jgi:hypothetical protein
MSRAFLKQLEEQAKASSDEFVWITSLPSAVLALGQIKQR